MSIFIKKLFNRFFDSKFKIHLLSEIPHLEDSEKDKLDKYILSTNLFRDILVSLILLGTNIVLLVSDNFLHKKIFDNSLAFRFLYYSRILYILFSALFLCYYFIYHHKYNTKTKKLKLLHYSFMSISTLWATFLSLNAIALHGQISAFFITMFTISFFITLDSNERIAFIIIPTFLLNIALYLFAGKTSALLGNVLNTTFSCLLCVLISSAHEIFLKNYIIKSAQLHDKNVELMEVKTHLEYEIENRSEELTNAHNLLLTEILESHNYEMELLKSQMELEKNTQRLHEIEAYETFRTEFFANISHELKTPLNVIFSAQQILNKNINSGDLDIKSCNKYSSIIKQNCFRLIRLIGNLIDLTKLDSGYLTISPSNNDIVKVVEDITLSVATFIEEKEIELIFDTTSEELVIACDPENIERIVLNLLSNSVKFTPKGGRISVSITDSFDSVVISVSDTGIGIPKELQPTIFERFVQADKSITRNREGSGIGLSLVKSLVLLHSGDISLESLPSKGTTIMITLPKKLVPLSADPITQIAPKEYSYNEHVEKISIEFSDIYS